MNIIDYGHRELGKDAEEPVDDGSQNVQIYQPSVEFKMWYFAIPITFVVLFVLLCVFRQRGRRIENRKSQKPRKSSHPELALLNRNEDKLEVLLLDDSALLIHILSMDAEAILHPRLARNLIFTLYLGGKTPQSLETLIGLEINLAPIDKPPHPHILSPLLWRMLRKHALWASPAYLSSVLTSVVQMADSIAQTQQEPSLETMQGLVNELLSRILDQESINALPKQVGRVARFLYSSVIRHWPGRLGLAASCVGHYLCSGLIASGLIAPHACGLYPQPPPPFLQHILMHLTRILSHMGQGTTFGGDNPLDPLISELTPKLRQFLSHAGQLDINASSDILPVDFLAGAQAQKQQSLQSIMQFFTRNLPRLAESLAVHKLLESMAFLKDENPIQSPSIADLTAEEMAYGEFEKEKESAPISVDETIAKCMEELPVAVHRLVVTSGIPADKVNARFGILLNILHFKKLYPPRQLRHALLPIPSPSPSPSNTQAMIEELVTPGNPKRMYKNLIQIGKGGFGKVYAARTDKGRRIAIKRLPHSTSKEKRRNFTEAHLMHSFKTPNIVEFVACHLVESEMWIVMEYMAGGTLTQAAAEFSFTEEQVAYVARELLQALTQIHAKGYVHRDVKSDNCMMTTKGEIKLIDFGLCVNVEVESNHAHLVGSPFWMSPEMILRKSHTYANDIWSFAICLLELVNHHVPNKDSFIKAMFMVATEGLPNPFEKPAQWSPLLHDFISQCLQTDHTRRPSAIQLLQHPFLLKSASHESMETLLSQIFVKNLLEQSGI